MGKYARIVGPGKALGTVSTEAGLDRRALLRGRSARSVRTGAPKKILEQGN
jgi:hypothetical protein